MRTNLTVDNYRRFSSTKNFFTVEKLWLFWTVFWGQRWQHWYLDDQNTIKAIQSHMNVLLISKVDNIQNPCLSLKSGIFLYFIGLWILFSRTNMVPKIYRDLSALGICDGKEPINDALQPFRSWSISSHCVWSWLSVSGSTARNFAKFRASAQKLTSLVSGTLIWWIPGSGLWNKDENLLLMFFLTAAIFSNLICAKRNLSLWLLCEKSYCILG